MKILLILVLFTILINLINSTKIYTSFQLTGCDQGDNTFPIGFCHNQCGIQAQILYHSEINEYAFNQYGSTDTTCFGAIGSQKYFTCNGVAQSVLAGKNISCSVPTELLSYTTFNITTEGCDPATSILSTGVCDTYCGKFARVDKESTYSSVSYILRVSDQGDCSNPEPYEFNCLSGNKSIELTGDIQVVCVDTSNPGSSSSSSSSSSSQSDNENSDSSIIKYSMSILVSIVLLNLFY